MHTGLPLYSVAVTHLEFKTEADIYHYQYMNIDITKTCSNNLRNYSITK